LAATAGLVTQSRVL